MADFVLLEFPLGLLGLLGCCFSLYDVLEAARAVFHCNPWLLVCVREPVAQDLNNACFALAKIEAGLFPLKVFFSLVLQMMFPERRIKMQYFLLEFPKKGFVPMWQIYINSTM